MNKFLKLESSKKPTITIVNAWSDDNKGDLGIAQGTILVIKRSFPKASINIISLLDQEPKINHGLLLKANKHINVFKPIYKKNIIFPFLLLKDYLTKTDKNNKSIKAIGDSDLVVVMGGHYFATHGIFNLKNLAHFLHTISPLIIASKMKKPIVLLGHSVGPFTNLFSKTIFKWVLGKTKYIGLRENISYEYLLNVLKVKKDVLEIIPDLAFALSFRESRKTSKHLNLNKIKKNNYWIITVRRWGGKNATEKYIVEMEKFIRLAFQRNLTKCVLLLIQCHGPIGIEDDKQVTDELYQRVKDLPVIKLVNNFTLKEYFQIYRNSNFLIGTRFHSVIFSASVGTPVFAVSYYGPKAHGIMNMLEMKNLCVDMVNFNANEVINKISDLNLKVIGAKLERKSSKLRNILFLHVGNRIKRVFSEINVLQNNKIS